MTRSTPRLKAYQLLAADLLMGADSMKIDDQELSWWKGLDDIVKLYLISFHLV